MHSLVAMAKSLKRTVASWAVVWAGGELVAPKVVDAVPDFVPGPKNSLAADHILKGAGPMMVGTEPG